MQTSEIQFFKKLSYAPIEEKIEIRTLKPWNNFPKLIESSFTHIFEKLINLYKTFWYETELVFFCGISHQGRHFSTNRERLKSAQLFITSELPNLSRLITLEEKDKKSLQYSGLLSASIKNKAEKNPVLKVGFAYQSK